MARKMTKPQMNVNPGWVAGSWGVAGSCKLTQADPPSLAEERIDDE
jgi:hypothetical protein